MKRPSSIISYYKACLDECTKTQESIRTKWEINQQRYMCNKDWSKKRDWQFKTLTPIAKPKVRRAANLIKMTLLKAPDYFDFETPKRSTEDPEYKHDILRCNYTKRLLRAHMDAEPCNFILNFCESIEAALAYSGLMVMKFWVGYVKYRHIDVVSEEIVKGEKLCLRSKAIDPYNFYFTNDGRIQVERQYVTIPELHEMIDGGLIAAHPKRLKSVLNGDYSNKKELDEEERARLKRLGVDEYDNEYRKTVCLDHFWGPLIDKNNRVVKEHVHFIVANEKYLLTEVMPNPYYDKSTPYVYAPINKVPFRALGKSLTEDVNSIEDAINDFVNLQLDNLLWQLLGVREVDAMALDSLKKKGLKDLYPGATIPRRSTSTELAFRFHELGADPNKAIPILQELRLFHDQDHGVTDFVSANVVPDVTATEQRQKRSDALSMFEGLATEIERGFFKRCIDKQRDLVLQFMADPLTDPNVETILGQEGIDIDGMSDKERRSLIVSEYNIVPKGVSVFFERMRKLNSYAALYKVLNAFPDEAKMWINWKSFLVEILNLFAFDNPEDKLRPEDEVKAMLAQAQQQQQQRLQLEIQKHLLPMQTKLQQTVLGIKERMQTKQQQLQADMQKEMARLQQDMMKHVMTIEQKERERRSKQAIELLKEATS
jgi:gas vesicle protein